MADVKRHRARLVSIIALAVASAMILTGCGGKTKDADTVQEPASAQRVAPVQAGQWAEVMVLGGGSYYGKVAGAPAGFVALETPYYPLAQDDGDTVKLRAVGAEFHKPDRFLLIPIDSVVSVQALSGDSGVVKVISEDLASSGAPAVDLGSAQDIPVAGLFLTDGRLVFGHAVIRNDGWVSVEGAHYLTRNPDSDTNAPIETLDDLLLVPQMDSGVGHAGVLFLSLGDILLIERMSGESPVLQALSEASSSTTETPNP